MEKQYTGSELELFSKAVNWKKYFSSFIRPYLKGKTLEVGAGQGGTTEIFSDIVRDNEWLCLEPDKQLYDKLLSLKANNKSLSKSKTINGTLKDIPTKYRFDSILYIDVIEHIENASKELQLAQKYLIKGGFLIILVPAHNFLYSPFDKSIGHQLRYNKKSLKDIIPKVLHKVNLSYLDSAGLLASAMNKLVLKQNIPTEKQILFWDNNLIKISKSLDKILSFSIGKSLIGIWQKK